MSRRVVDDRIGLLLKRAQHGLRAEMDRVLERRGLTTPQYATLSTLEHEPRISSAELARRSFVTPQTMIKIVENLEGLGLVERERHSTHGRILVASLTAAGRRAVAGCHADVNAVERDMLRGLDSRERETLADLLHRCINGLENSGR